MSFAIATNNLYMYIYDNLELRNVNVYVLLIIFIVIVKTRPAQNIFSSGFYLTVHFKFSVR